ncbi:MAG: hypothetical protein GKS00_03440 [Alphaproteobacteria bacterium]|nr:hypothetical protein [Alphaproteobacteria bacterium]
MAAKYQLLIISGPIGVGKTTIGDEIGVLLTKKKIANTFIDLDALTQSFPRPPDDPYGDRLACLNLGDVWANCKATGSRNLFVSRVVEDRGALERITSVVPECASTLCQMNANAETLLKRVQKREVGSLLDWHEKRTLELAESLEKNGPFDFKVTTDARFPIEIASEIVDRVEWAI